jgi:serine/threonine protein phosphatase PrpC
MIGAASGGRLVVRAVLRTDVGKVRSENQDFGAVTSREEETKGRAGGRLLIVADGMGGHRGGATASRLAAETIKTQYIQSDTEDIPAALRDALVRANSRIFSEAQQNPDLRGMGTTTSALAVKNGQGWFAHVGDSRIYLVRNGEIKQLTDDHSLVASMVREGLLTSDEAANHPRRNVLQRSMGVGEEVEIDIRGPIELREGDTFILCSDGLHGVVKEDEMKQVAGVMPIEQGAEELLRRALDRGAPDNVTVIVARVERDGTAGEATLVDRTVEDDVFVDDDTLVDQPPIAAAPEPGVVFEESPPPPPVPAPPIHAPSAAVTAPGDAAISSARMPSLDQTQPVAAQKPRPTVAPAAAPDPWAGPVKRRSSASSIFKWALLFVLILGAAGGWLFWQQQQKLGKPSSTSSR